MNKADAGAAVAAELPAVREAAVRGAPLAVRFNPDQVDLIKRTVAKGATDDELRLFLYQAQRTGLDPISRQIHYVKRYDSNAGGYVGAVQVGIDGYRVVAQRTGQYAGNDDYEFGGEAEDAFDFTDKSNRRHQGKFKRPTTAKARVWRLVSGARVAFEATARWGEYYPGDRGGHMWRKLPYLMLGKCAEALALRKAFPAELSGIYTHEEMAQADRELQDVLPPAPATTTTATVRDIAPDWQPGLPDGDHAGEAARDAVLAEDADAQTPATEPPDAGAEQAPVSADPDMDYVLAGEQELKGDWKDTYATAYAGIAADDMIASRAAWFHVWHAFALVKKHGLTEERKAAFPDLTFKRPMDPKRASEFRAWCVEKGCIKKEGKS